MKASNIDNLSPCFFTVSPCHRKIHSPSLFCHPTPPNPTSQKCCSSHFSHNQFVPLFSFVSNFPFFLRRLPDFKQRIAGQSLPFEDFAIHKANKYFEQKGRLFLPGVVSPILFDILLTLYSVTSVGIFSTLFSIHSSRC